jgi:hypothetical protein
MKIRTLVPAAAAVVVLGTAGWIAPQAFAQAFRPDVVRVTLPYPVIVGDKTLPPGEYTIEPLPDVGDPPVIVISNGNDTKVETMAMFAMTLHLRPPVNSSVSLYQLGNNYYLDKVWVQGNPYGFRVALPKSVRNREKDMEPVSLPAR